MSQTQEPNLEPSPVELEERYQVKLHRSRRHHDQMFVWVLLIQWVACMGMAAWVSPRTWDGVESTIHPHLIAAFFLGGLISFYPVFLVRRQMGTTYMRYVIAVAQMLMSALIIHLMGGRIEAHFHVFASLALLAFYRDIRLLLVASLVVFVDHLFRGIYWPQSVFGSSVELPVLRAIEHAGWVTLEVTVLAISIRKSQSEVREMARRQIVLENSEALLEQRVAKRTQALKESEERAREVFDSAVIGLFHCDSEGHLLDANPAMTQLLGYASFEEMTTAIQSLNDVVAGEVSWVDRVVQDGDYQNRESLWSHRDGHPVPVRETVRATLGTDGKVLRIEGSVEDLTELKDLEERYLQSQKVQALGQLSAGIAHDFNNVLTSIVGFSDLVVVEPNISPEVRDQVREIRKAADRATSLTAQLLAFSRKQTFQPQDFLLHNTVEEMAKLLRRLAGEDIFLNVTYPDELPSVHADPSQIQQVILNLAVNARDAMPNGGELSVAMEAATLEAGFQSICGEALPGQYVCLKVRDTGSGIPKEIQTRIFDPFFSTKGPSGTGLGLATCIGIVKQSGGHIMLESEMGEGTTFLVYLPAGQKVEPDLPVSSKDEVIHGKGLILLAEDEEIVRKLGLQALTSLGYQVIEATNGADALQKFEQHSHPPISVVMTDVMMPAMGGIELADRLRELAPDLPIIFSSGYTDDAISNTDALAKGNYFIQKPYSIANLARKIHEVLEATDSAKKAA